MQVHRVEKQDTEIATVSKRKLYNRHAFSRNPLQNISSLTVKNKLTFHVFICIIFSSFFSIHARQLESVS